MKFFINIPKYQLYLLQLENYELLRYLQLLFKKGLFPKGEQRKSLVWTAKATIIFLLAEVLVFTAGGLSFWLFRAELGNIFAAVAGFLVIGLLKVLPFVGFILSVMILFPLDFLLKQILVFRARHKINSLPGLQVIGIAGSYGKTTMKEVLVQVLSVKYKVKGTPESVNTPVGIARWVLKEINSKIEIVIIEMGEHYQGDVEEVCNIAKPNIVVVTGINEAHLERMKTLENITDTIFEIVSQSKPGATVLLNADDQRVMANYKKYVWPDHKLAMYGQRNNESRLRQGYDGQAGIKNYEFNPEQLSWKCFIDGLGETNINLLGEYALGDVSAAIQVGRSLGLNNEEIKKGLEKIQPIEHRLQPIKSAGQVLVIDDAYNGNSAGVTEAIKVLARFKDRRKIFITPGLVETGKQAETVHKKIGQELASVADLVILIKNSVSPFIEQGLKSENYPAEKIVWFKTAQEAHENLKNILKPKDVILFQNDWGDQYI